MWLILQSIHEGTRWANRLALERRLILLKMGTDKSMQEHINKVNKTVDKLTSVGVPIKETFRIIILLASLPDLYKHMITSIESRLDEDGLKKEATPEVLAYVTKRLLKPDELSWMESGEMMLHC